MAKAISGCASCVLVAGFQSWILLSTVAAIHAFAPPRAPVALASSAASRPALQQLRVVSYSELLERIPSDSVIDAVEAESSKNAPVLVSDVAAKAGISLSQARRDVTTLASLTQANLAVSNDGDILYSFPASVRSTLAQNSAKYKLLDAYDSNVKPVLFYLLRVSFGVVLLTSLAAIFTSILVISSSSSSDEDDRRGGGGRGGLQGEGNLFAPSYFWGPSPFDFFYYRPYYGYYYTAPGEERQRQDPEDMGFLESVFSYLFGDGNPNVHLEEERLRLVASMIRENSGAVTAEQLAPFCDELPDPKQADRQEVNVDEVSYTYLILDFWRI